MKQRTGAVAALVAMSLLTACYSYKPIDSVSPKPGKRIALTLTPEGVRKFTLRLGPQSTYLEGDLLEADSAAVRVSLKRVEDSRHTGTSWNGEEVSIPRELIASMSERHLSIGATVIASGLAVGSMIGAYAAFGTSSEAEGAAVTQPIPHQ